VDPAEVDRLRARLELTPRDVVVGSFGTYAGGIADLLARTLRTVLERDRSRVALLIGKRSDEFAAAVAPSGARVLATGELELDAIAAHLAACTVVLQPYPDGVNARRGSTMASLALGVPVVTNSGHNTEPLWREGGVALAPDPTPESLASLAESLLGDPSLRRSIGDRGQAIYRARLSLACVIEALRR
jgi:glycosyltransferase involved in cell wall biosynthesis